MTVFENVRISAQPPSLDYRIWARYDGDSARDAKTARIIESVGLADKQEKLASHLSYGDRRRLELGMALGNDPSLLLLDEPTAGMTPAEIRAHRGVQSVYFGNR